MFLFIILYSTFLKFIMISMPQFDHMPWLLTPEALIVIYRCIIYSSHFNKYIKNISRCNYAGSGLYKNKNV